MPEMGLPADLVSCFILFLEPQFLIFMPFNDHPRFARGGGLCYFCCDCANANSILVSLARNFWLMLLKLVTLVLTSSLSPSAIAAATLACQHHNVTPSPRTNRFRAGFSAAGFTHRLAD